MRGCGAFLQADQPTSPAQIIERPFVRKKIRMGVVFRGTGAAWMIAAAAARQMSSFGTGGGDRIVNQLQKDPRLCGDATPFQIELRGWNLHDLSEGVSGLTNSTFSSHTRATPVLPDSRKLFASPR